MIEVERRGRIGWNLTLVTKKYRRTLWIDWPRLTKLSRPTPPAQQLDGQVAPDAG